MMRTILAALALTLFALPAAAQNFFYVFEGDATKHRLKEIFATQADANASAAGDADLFANQGAVDVPDHVSAGWIREPPSTDWRAPTALDAPMPDQIINSANLMMTIFEDALAFMQAAEHAWPAAQIDKARTAIHWQLVNAIRFAQSPLKSEADRLKFLEEAASWPMTVNGDVVAFINGFQDSVAVPGKDYSWVNPTASPVVQHPDSEIAGGFTNAEDVVDAPAVSTLLGRAWIANIP